MKSEDKQDNEIDDDIEKQKKFWSQIKDISKLFQKDIIKEVKEMIHYIIFKSFVSFSKGRKNALSTFEDTTLFFELINQKIVEILHPCFEDMIDYASLNGINDDLGNELRNDIQKRFKKKYKTGVPEYISLKFLETKKMYDEINRIKASTD